MATAMLAAATGAMAQVPSPAAPAMPPTAARSTTYQSPFDTYRRFSEEPVVPWQQANDLVGRIGGWKAYAREAAGSPTLPASAPDAAAPGARKP
jgi:hypothetical protein